MLLKMMAGKTFINSKATLPIVGLLLFFVAQIAGDGSVAILMLSSGVEEWLLKPWTLLSYGLVHTSWWHFVVNIILLSWLAISRYVRVKEYWGLFLLGVLLGAVVFIIGGDGVLLGASSGIAAIVPIEVVRRLGKKWGVVVFSLWVFIIEFVTRGAIGGVEQSIHMAGYLIGITYLLTPWGRMVSEPTERADLVERAYLSGYSSLTRREREEIRQMDL